MWELWFCVNGGKAVLSPSCNKKFWLLELSKDQISRPQVGRVNFFTLDLLVTERTKGTIILGLRPWLGRTGHSLQFSCSGWMR
jgi:hypothetical protein